MMEMVQVWPKSDPDVILKCTFVIFKAMTGKKHALNCPLHQTIALGRLLVLCCALAC